MILTASNSVCFLLTNEKSAKSNEKKNFALVRTYLSPKKEKKNFALVRTYLSPKIFFQLLSSNYPGKLLLR